MINLDGIIKLIEENKFEDIAKLGYAIDNKVDTSDFPYDKLADTVDESKIYEHSVDIPDEDGGCEIDSRISKTRIEGLFCVEIMPPSIDDWIQHYVPITEQADIAIKEIIAAWESLQTVLVKYKCVESL